MKRNWEKYEFVADKNYKDITYCEIVAVDFDGCSFEQVVFRGCLFSIPEFKNCSFVNCSFIAVTFDHSLFVKCVFYECEFIKDSKGSPCTAETSYAIDCIIDERSAENNPLIVQLGKDVLLLSPKLKQQICVAFQASRPSLAVIDPGHCLSCSETQEAHEKLKDIEELSVDSFNVCYMSVEAFSEDGLLYYMPKLLELLLLGKENDWDSFRTGFLSQLVPNKFGDRFEKYNQEQVQLIIEVLDLYYEKYNRIEETWDYEAEMMTDNSMYKDQLAYCEKALVFWNKKKLS